MNAKNIILEYKNAFDVFICKLIDRSCKICSLYTSFEIEINHEKTFFSSMCFLSISHILSSIKNTRFDPVHKSL